MYQYQANRTLGMNTPFANYAGPQVMARPPVLNNSRFPQTSYAPQMVMTVPVSIMVVD